MKIVLLTLASLLVAAAASAQTVTITGLTVTVTTAGGVVAVPPQTAAWPPAAGSCNLAATPVPVGTVINPAFIEQDDPAVTGRVCRINFGVYFATLPAASGYRASTTYLYSDGIRSGASNVTLPFDVQVVVQHAAPTGVGVR